jgi:hypothetical protein
MPPVYAICAANARSGQNQQPILPDLADDFSYIKDDKD